MATIKPIEHKSVHQIQSGQVIVDIGSVVKELVENSFDAGATVVDVRFKNQGLDSIEVQDNGSGISTEDFETVALKHHTSKLSTYADLASIQTFGFRGEALASLCALSHMTIVTCRASDVPKGSRLEFEPSGKLQTATLVAVQKGTTVTVDNLFHNLPVRRRELERNIKREWAKIIALLNQYACIQTGVKFTVSQQPTKGKRIMLFATKGNPSVRENVMNIFGAKAMATVVALDLELELRPTAAQPVVMSKGLSKNDQPSKTIMVQGLVSRPAHGEGRQVPDRQMFFVNGRPCGLPQFARVFNDVYRSYNASQSPFILADARLDTNLYDVNVSPDKRTILLHDQDQLLEALRHSLVEKFNGHDYTVPANQAMTQTPRATAVAAGSNKRLEPPSSPYSASALPKASLLPAESVPDHHHDHDSSQSMHMRGEIKRGGQSGAGRFGYDQEAGQLRIPSNNSKPDASPCRDHDDSQEPDDSTAESSDPDQDDEVGNDYDPEGSDDGESIADSQHPYHASAAGSYDHDAAPLPENRRPTRGAPSLPISGPAARNVFDKMMNAMTKPRIQPKPAPRMTTRRVPNESSLASGCAKASLRRYASTVEDGPISAGIGETAGRRRRTVMDPSSDDEDEDLEEEEPPPMIPVESVAGRSPSSLEPAHSEDAPGMTVQVGLPLHATGVIGDGSEESEDAGSETSVEPEAKTAQDKVPAPLARNLGKPTRRASTRDLVQYVVTTETAIHESFCRWRESIGPSSSRAATSQSPSRLDADDAEERLSLTVSKTDFAKMKVVGQFNLGFILAMRSVRPAGPGAGPSGDDDPARDDDLFIIDQHASDEKYNFERLQAETVVQSQRLVQSKRLELTALEEEIVINNLKALADNGFRIEVDDPSEEQPTGSRCRLVALPLSRETTFTLSDLQELIYLLGEQDLPAGTIPRPSRVRSMFAMRACRSSIMIGKALSRSQMEKVVRHMGELDKPWNCPHGRPTMRHLSGLRNWETCCWKADEI